MKKHERQKKNEIKNIGKYVAIKANAIENKCREIKTLLKKTS
jgi:hypothetical protein